MKLPKENVKKQKGVKSYITLRQSTFRGAGIKWKALEGRAGTGSDQDGQMSQSLGEIRQRTSTGGRKRKWELPPRSTAPTQWVEEPHGAGRWQTQSGQRPGSNGTAHGQCGLREPLLRAFRAAPQTTSLHHRISSR